ncbi:hypothetical protein TcasGA2_TC031864 [Tribolium castaneum]|uniref:Reverse transcriptase zinc-binding domain-containing protein n=1 Tax=Tribolium castaneum TaxID=7070 RepID=A0A139W9D2_TRICA|nr:hypothetical protein TcasGA2_TC031864 [Tribolium castaneum]
MSHLQRVGKSETDECAECGVRDDPIHRLLVCPLFDVPRRDIYRSVDSPFLSLNWIIHLKSELLEPFTALPVARVRPRTSKGITDLLLLNLVRLEAACPSKKNCLYADSKNRT